MLTNVSSQCVYTLYSDTLYNNSYIHQANCSEQVYNMSQCNVHSQVATPAGEKVTNVIYKCLM